MRSNSGKSSLPSFSRGMTLLELILAVTLVGLVGLSFAAIYGSSQRYLVQDMTQVGAQSEAAFALAHMTRNIQPKANRMIRFSDTKLAFRFDTDPLGVEPADPLSDDAWGGYRLNGTTLNFASDMGIAGGVDPVVGDLEAAAAEAVSQGVIFLEMRLPNSTAGSSEISPPEPPRLTVIVEAERNVGPETRRSQLQTIITPRGIPEGG